MAHCLDPAAVHRHVRRLAWTAFGIVAALYLLSFFHRMAPAAIADELAREFSASGAALGSLAATYFYVYTLMQLPTGVLVDTVGPRRIVSLGGLVAGAGSILFGLAPSLVMASAGRLLVGLGVSVMFIALLKLNASWFAERRFGTLTGLTMLLGNLGAVLSAAPLAWLLAAVSWRSVFVAVGLLSLLLAAACWLLVRDDPRHAGLPTPREMEGRDAHAEHEGHWYDGLVEVLRNRATWPGFFVTFGIAGSFFAFAGLWGVPWLVGTQGMTRAVAAQHTSLLLVGFAAGALFAGTLSDRIGRRRPVILGGCLVYAACWLPLLAGTALPRAASYGLFALMGLAQAGFTLTWAAAKEVNRHALSGMATSVVNTGGFLGAAIMQPLVGWAMDVSAGGSAYGAEEWRLGVAILFGFVLVGLGGAVAVRETWCRYADDIPRSGEISGP